MELLSNLKIKGGFKSNQFRFNSLSNLNKFKLKLKMFYFIGFEVYILSMIFSIIFFFFFFMTLFFFLVLLFIILSKLSSS